MSRRHTKIDKQKIADKLRLYRKERNMTQEELARMLDVSVFSLHRWEAAKNFPSSSAMRLMKMLKIITE